MRLTKSLAELDAAADELLAKSKSAEEEKESAEEDVKPEEVSDEAATEKDEAEEREETVEKSEETEAVEEETVEKSEETEAVEEETVEKSEDTEEVDEDEDEEESAEDVQKSIQEDFEADETIQKSVGDSEFSAAVVEILSKALGDMQYGLNRSGKAQSAATDILAKSLQAVMQTNQRLQADNDRLTRRINKLEKSITQGFERVMDSLDEISAQPVGMRKSIKSISVHDRDFSQTLGAQQTGGFESLSKAQVLGVLNAELYAGNQNVTPSDIISYESGAPLREDLKALVANKCK